MTTTAASALYAQKKTITGAVLDSEKKPLGGASILVKNGSQATRSSGAGTFSIEAARTDTLVISYVGYETRELVVGNQLTINVTLQQTATNLNDVVVIGYGSVRRKDVTGSVGTVNVQDLQKAPVRSFEEALGGRVAGVQAFSNDGQPGSSYNIVIRGNNSVTQNNSPLYVIDGFPIENADNNSINPADIESIEILKDASSTAIYGARGANGVIIITTKRGRSAVPVVSYDGYAGVQKTTRTMDLMNPYEYVSYLFSIDSAKTRASFLTAKNLTLDDYKNIKGIDWQDEVLQTAMVQNHNLSISGVNGKTRYSVSGSVLDQDGIIVNSGFRRYQGRLTLDQEVSSKLKVGVNVNYSSAKTNGMTPALLDGSTSLSTYNLFYNVWTYRPTDGGNEEALLDAFIDPSITNPAADLRINPVMSVKNELRNTFTDNLFANAYAEYAFSKSLKLRVAGGLTRQTIRREVFYNSHTRLGSSLVSGLNNVNGSVTNLYNDNLLNENTLVYDKHFNKNNALNIVAGFTMQKTRSGSGGYAATALPNESLGISGLDEGTPLNVVSTSSANGLVSLLARANYNFKGRYLFTASIRSDASSKFTKENRSSIFPSGAFAWRFTDEAFMKNARFITDSKLRLSYGVTGNNRVNDFAYLSTINYPVTMYSFNNGLYNTSQPGVLGNPDLVWESTAQFDAGLDLNFFNQRVNFTVDYYNKKTYDLLINASLPYISGYATAFKNVGKVRNEGLEFSLNTVNVDGKDFKWTSSFNISFNKNRVLALNEEQESITTAVPWDNSYKASPTYIAKIGQPIAQFYGYVWEGNYQYSDFDKLPNGTYVLKANVPNNGNPRANIKPGDIKYKDINGDGTVNTFDVTAIGNPYPDHIGGFSNNFTYRNFDLNIFLQWSYGNEIYNANRLLLEGNSLYSLNQFASYNNRWTPENQNNTYFRYGGQGPLVNSSRVVEDGSFLRLKTVSLGYTIPASALKAIKVRSIRVYASAQNLWVWTKYSGMDPEVSTRQTTLTPGFDYSPYPRAFTLIGGVKINF